MVGFPDICSLSLSLYIGLCALHLLTQQFVQLAVLGGSLLGSFLSEKVSFLYLKHLLKKGLHLCNVFP